MALRDLFKPNIDALAEKKDVEGLISALRRSSDPAVRKRAAEALGELREYKAGDALIAALGKEDPARKKAAEALGSIAYPRAIGPLLKLLRDSDDGMRVIAIVSLGRLGDQKATGPLIAMLRDKNRSIREAAAESLQRIGTPAVESLCQALNDENVHVRANAIVVLGKIGDRRATESLCRTLAADRELARYAAEALGDLRDTAALEPLIQALKQCEGAARAKAAEALGKMGSRRAVESLILALDTDIEAGAAAAEALGRIGDPRAVRHLESALRADREEIRHQAERALEAMGFADRDAALRRR
ncbi:MAG: HEAT repeat domain-containing protein [Methanobacteriota archaeon]|nr:MAG: HEAT repeat domain-containing protein [Euryarchaeota archaeon]